MALVTDRPRVWLGAAALLVALAAGVASAQSQSHNAASADSVGRGGARPGDIIRVWVWREPDYSGEFPVDLRGKVVLPLLGEVSVPGRTAEALADSLRQAYGQYLRNPSIEVTVLRRVAVQGEVGKPGLYPADATITVGELIALAGGVTANGNQKKVKLLRDGRVIVSGLGPGTVLQRSPVQSGDEIFVPQRGWLSRNSGVFLWGVVSVTAGIATALIAR